MPQKITVNGVEYDSPDAMPPDVRRQYESALQLIQDLGKGAAPRGSMEKTVERTPDGVSVKIRVNDVQYTVNGETYAGPPELPPEVRERVERALAEATQLEVRDHGARDVRVVQLDAGASVRAHGRRLVWWLVIGAIALVLLSRL